MLGDGQSSSGLSVVEVVDPPRLRPDPLLDRSVELVESSSESSAVVSADEELAGAVVPVVPGVRGARVVRVVRVVRVGAVVPSVVVSSTSLVVVSSSVDGMMLTSATWGSSLLTSVGTSDAGGASLLDDDATVLAVVSTEAGSADDDEAADDEDDDEEVSPRSTVVTSRVRGTTVEPRSPRSSSWALAAPATPAASATAPAEAVPRSSFLRLTRVTLRLSR